MVKRKNNKERSEYPIFSTFFNCRITRRVNLFSFFSSHSFKEIAWINYVLFCFLIKYILKAEYPTLFHIFYCFEVEMFFLLLLFLARSLEIIERPPRKILNMLPRRCDTTRMAMNSTTHYEGPPVLKIFRIMNIFVKYFSLIKREKNILKFSNSQIYKIFFYFSLLLE